MIQMKKIKSEKHLKQKRSIQTQKKSALILLFRTFTTATIERNFSAEANVMDEIPNWNHRGHDMVVHLKNTIRSDVFAPRISRLYTTWEMIKRFFLINQCFTLNLFISFLIERRLLKDSKISQRDFLSSSIQTGLFLVQFWRFCSLYWVYRIAA